MPSRPIRVLVVDDSALMRQIVTAALSEDLSIEVVGHAQNPNIAREKIKALDPDVITLDIEMPEMDGIEFLSRLMRLRPTRVLMVSSLTGKNTEMTLRALEIGAVDCLEKPQDHGEASLSRFREALMVKVHAVATARLGAVALERRPSAITRRASANRNGLIAIGASTGGVEALLHVMQELPPDLPPIVIVQHMPPKFTASFARRLDQASALTVREAEDGAELHAGEALVSPGGFHLMVKRSGDRFRCIIDDSAPVSGHKPSVDRLFSSVARAAGREAIGVILTGMGKDGAAGLLDMREAGALTLGQDEKTALVYGMPRVAFEMGAVARQLPLGAIAGAIAVATEFDVIKKHTL